MNNLIGVKKKSQTLMSVASLPDELHDLFEAEKEVLQAEFARGKVQHDHGTLRGNISERVLREFLEKYLPSTYRYANGEIMDRDGTYSNEVDIAICSSAHPFTFSKEGSGLLFVEGVDAVVECKSSLKSNTLPNAVQNCRSVRNLDAQTPTGTMTMAENHDPGERIKLTPHAIFAYGSDLALGTVIERIQDIKADDDLSDEELPDIVCMLNRGTVIRDRSIDNLEVEPGSESYHILEEPPLLVFLTYLYDKMPTPLVARNPLTAYI